MSQIVKCPGCDSALQIDLTQGQAHFICPNCQLKFEAPNAKRQADVVKPNIKVGVKTKRKVRYRKKKSPLPMVLGLLGLTAFVAVLGGVAYNVRQQQIASAALEQEKIDAALQAQQAASELEESRRAAAARARELKEQQDAVVAEPEVVTLDIAPPEPEPEPEPVDPIRQLLETLDRSGHQCETFQFVPEDPTQYEQLQIFARQLSLAKSLLAEHQATEIDSQFRESVAKQSTHWRQTMKTLVRQVSVDAPRRLPRVNAFAKHEFEKELSPHSVSSTDNAESVNLADPLDLANSQIVFYGAVFLDGKKDPHAILKLDREQAYFSVPKNPEFEPFRDEIYRLYFVEAPETPVQFRMNSPGGGLIKFSPIKLIDAFDPLSSGE